MKRIIITVTLLGLFLSSSVIAAESTKDDDLTLQAKIIGSWAEGPSPYGISTFKKDGVYEAKMWPTAERQKLIVSAEGKWWIKDGKLYNTVHKVEPPIFPATQEPIVDVIVDISDQLLTLIDSEGKKYTKARVK